MIIGPHTKTKPISTPRATNKSIRVPTPEPSYFRPHNWNQVNLDPHYTINSISMPRHINRTNVDPVTGSKSLFTDTQESSEFRSLHWNQIDSDLQHWNQVNFNFSHYNQTNAIPSLKLSQVRSSALKSGQFQPPTQKRRHFRSSHSNQSVSARKQKSCQIQPPKKRPSQSTTTLKTSQIRSMHYNQFISVPYTQKSRFWPNHWYHANLDPGSNVKPIWMPRQKKRVNFDLYVKDKFFRPAH